MDPHRHPSFVQPQYNSNFLDTYQQQAECAYTAQREGTGYGAGYDGSGAAAPPCAPRPAPDVQWPASGGAQPPPRPPVGAPSESRQWFVTNDHPDTRATMSANNVIPPPVNKEAIESTKHKFVVVDSASRNHDDYPEPNHYRIPLPGEIRDVRSIQLVSYKVPTPQFPVRGTNNVLHLTNTDPTVTLGDDDVTYDINLHKDTNTVSVAVDPGYYDPATSAHDHTDLAALTTYRDVTLASHGISGLQQDALARALETKLNATTNALCLVHIEPHSNRYVLRTNFLSGAAPVFFHAFFQGCTEFYGPSSTEVRNISGDDDHPVYQKQRFGKTEHLYLPNSIGPVLGHPRTDADTRLKGTVTCDGTTLTGVGTSFASQLQKGDSLYVVERDTNTKHVVVVTEAPEVGDETVAVDGAAFATAYAWVGRISFPWVRNLAPDCYTVMRLDRGDTLTSFTPALDRGFFVIPHKVADFHSIKTFLPIKHYSPTLGRLTGLTIEFVNADGSRYDFMGRDHTLLFKVEHYRQNVNYGDF